MLRSPTSMACRMLNGILVNSTCRTRLHRQADDMTKGISGLLLTHQTNYHKSCCPLTHENSAVHFLHHKRCVPATTFFKNTDGFSPTAFPSYQFSRVACYSTSSVPDKDALGASDIEQKVSSQPTAETQGEEKLSKTEGEEKLSIFQRFKRAYKEHGKILIGVHVATSIVWYSSFYAAARCGLDLVPYMEQWGFSETVIKPFRAGGLGDFALAYLMYKLATPARYTMTLAGTNLVIRHLRSRGKMAPKSQEDSLRQLYEEGKLRTSSLRQDRLKKLKEARVKKKAEKRQQGKR